MKKILCFLFLALMIQFTNAQSNNHDIVVYGGTSAGVAAAIQSSRMNKSVVLIEPTNRIGGLTTGGLGQTDIGNKQAIGGISREFYENIRKHYDNPSSWNWQKKSDYKDGGQTVTEDSENSMWTFEPSAALDVYKKMIAKENITLIYNERLKRKDGVQKVDGKIRSIEMESGNRISGKIFIDATYEGDLMAAAGVSYTVGRESNKKYGETVNGVNAIDWDTTLTGGKSKNAYNHNFRRGVDPYVVEGDRSSGLLPFINEKELDPHGSGDKKIQAYCFRMCLTDHPNNRIPFKKPEGYDELDYELLFRNYVAGLPKVPWINSSMPNRKTDINNSSGLSTDFIGQNYDYPEASYTEREKIVVRHRNYQKGLMWTLANHPRVPLYVREEVSRWGTCKDEFVDNDGWQDQLYIREARRMVSDLVMTQYHCEGLKVTKEPIGLAAYGMDSHHVQRYITDKGDVRNEGNIQAKVPSPFPIGYKSIVPKKDECTNLLVPICLSASHIAFGSIRMEPVFMVLGQSAALAGSLALDKELTVQDIPYDSLKDLLVRNKQRLSN